MKKISQINIALLSLFLLLSSCTQECDCSKISTDSDPLTRNAEVEKKSFRQTLVSSMAGQLSEVEKVPKFSFSENMLPKGIKQEDLEILTKKMAENQSEALANVQATELVTSIFNALIAVENSEDLLNVKFIMSDSPINNGSFIFGIEATNSQNLILTMYDEEGFGMVANNRFTIKEGTNYKSLKVSDLEPGGYIFKLKNEQDGKELVRRIEIAE